MLRICWGWVPLPEVVAPLPPAAFVAALPPPAPVGVPPPLQATSSSAASTPIVLKPRAASLPPRRPVTLVPFMFPPRANARRVPASPPATRAGRLVQILSGRP